MGGFGDAGSISSSERSKPGEPILGREKSQLEFDSAFV